MTNHNKYYYEKGRNGFIPEEQIINKRKINYEKNKTPNYYIGQVFGYTAKDIIEDFNLSYNIGTVCSYILRSGRKEEEGLTSSEKQIEDLIKAKNHIDFEIERLKRK